MKWLADSGHAWLEVSVEELKQLNIVKQITPFSYINGEYAYLEEDLDAGAYFAAKYKDPQWFKNETFLKEAQDIPYTEYKGDAPCRHYKHFYYGKVLNA